MMDLFIIGDVHGCLNTYLTLMDHWDPKKENLIQVGDLIDRGNYSPDTIRLAFELKKTFKRSVHFLRGNHEQMLLDYVHNPNADLWLSGGGKETLKQFENSSYDLNLYANWINTLPFFWENKDVYISHAGVGENEEIIFEPNHPDSVLWNRKPLKNIGKLQVYGHTPQVSGKPLFDQKSNAWNIDTGAFKGIALTGIKLKPNGTLKEIISIPTHPKDYQK